MKKTILVLIALILISSGNAGINGVRAGTAPQDNTMNILCTPDLYDLMGNLGSEYCKFNPDVNLKVIQVSETQIPEIFSAGNEIGFISKKYVQGIDPGDLWHIVIGREVIVPVINANNPFFDQISEKGITPELFAQLLSNHDNMNWGTLFNNGQKKPVHFYTINDALINSAISDFLNIKETSIKGSYLNDKQSLITAIQNDPLAIGFCKMTDIIDSENQSFTSNIKLLPIDKNGNGKIDYYENIYEDLLTFSRGVWIGKYPRSMVGDIYSVSGAKPTNNNEVNFLKWVLSEGQNLLQSNGISGLAFGERQMKLDKLRQEEILLAESNDGYTTAEIIFFIVIAMLVLGFILGYIVQRRKYRKGNPLNATTNTSSVFNEKSVQIPKGLFFDKSHTWAFMEQDGEVRIGIDDFLQHVTGPITRIKMKTPGDTIKKGEPILTLIQDGKRLNIHAPISGTITAINEELITHSMMLNISPYSDGWVYMIEPSNWLREIQFLAMANKYQDWLKNEFLRLKDFIATSTRINSLAYEPVILQEGGEIKDNVLKDFKPEVWEDFQKHFLDTSELR